MKIRAIILIILLTNLISSGQNTIDLELKRVKLDSWFSLLVPKNSENFQSHGSVDGGDIDSKEIEVEFNYWQNGDAPLYIKNAIKANSQPPISVCSDKLTTKIWNTFINGKKAIAQTCFDNNDSKFLYHITIPRLKVPNQESRKFRYGRFNLTIIYKDKILLLIAKRIANSLKFKY